MITVILNGYKRPYACLEQYNAIKAQTFKDIQIMFWANVVDNNIHFPEEVTNNCQTTISNTNYGVWGRFALALNAKTPFVCIIDDDTIPGTNWLQNCIDTYQQHPGVIATRGIIANSGKEQEYPGPNSYTGYGWGNPNEETVQVDMGCHCWFFHKDLLRAFWAEAPQELPMNYGEDMHLSYVAQKHFNLGTYVPPHPVDNLSLWGSQPTTGKKYGEDSVAISWNHQANMGMRSYWNFMLQNGYQTLSMKNDTQ
jgi:hypothetical protein